MRKITLRHPRIGAAAGLFLIALAVSPRGAAAQDAAAFIQNLGTQAIQVARPSVPAPQRTAVFRQLLAANFDLQDAARFVLGPAARGLTPAQHDEFMALFRDSLAEAYSKRLGGYAGDPLRVIGTRQVGDLTVVASQVMRHDGPPVRIDWHVVNRDGRLLVGDVDVDGVSQKVSQRQEFAAIIQRNGGRPDALLAALRQQLAGTPAAGSGSSNPQMPAPYR